MSPGPSGKREWPRNVRLLPLRSAPGGTITHSHLTPLALNGPFAETGRAGRGWCLLEVLSVCLQLRHLVGTQVLPGLRLSIPTLEPRQAWNIT